MTADVGIVRIQDTRIFPSMDHWTCLQPKDASATAVTAPIWQCVVRPDAVATLGPREPDRVLFRDRERRERREGDERGAPACKSTRRPRPRQAGSRRVDGVGAGAKIPHADRLICAPRRALWSFRCFPV